MAEKEQPLVDPTLARFAEHLGAFDELTHTVLKGHLLIEEALWRIVRKFVFHPEQLDKARISFHQLTFVARSLSLEEHENRMWDLIASINTLRNELAHSLDQPNKATKIAALRALYFEVCADCDDVKKDKALDDATIIAFASALAVGFLSSFEKEADRFKHWLNVLDRTVNRHRYKKAKISAVTKD